MSTSTLFDSFQVRHLRCEECSEEFASYSQDDVEEQFENHNCELGRSTPELTRSIRMLRPLSPIPIASSSARPSRQERRHPHPRPKTPIIVCGQVVTLYDDEVYRDLTDEANAPSPVLTDATLSPLPSVIHTDEERPSPSYASSVLTYLSPSRESAYLSPFASRTPSLPPSPTPSNYTVQTMSPMVESPDSDIQVHLPPTATLPIIIPSSPPPPSRVQKSIETCVFRDTTIFYRNVEELITTIKALDANPPSTVEIRAQKHEERPKRHKTTSASKTVQPTSAPTPQRVKTTPAPKAAMPVTAPAKAVKPKATQTPKRVKTTATTSHSAAIPTPDKSTTPRTDDELLVYVHKMVYSATDIQYDAVACRGLRSKKDDKWSVTNNLPYFKGLLYVPDNKTVRKVIVKHFHHSLPSLRHSGVKATCTAIAAAGYHWPSVPCPGCVKKPTTTRKPVKANVRNDVKLPLIVDASPMPVRNDTKLPHIEYPLANSVTNVRNDDKLPWIVYPETTTVRDDFKLSPSFPDIRLPESSSSELNMDIDTTAAEPSSSTVVNPTDSMVIDTPTASLSNDMDTSEPMDISELRLQVLKICHQQPDGTRVWTQDRHNRAIAIWDSTMRKRPDGHKYKWL
ncbi:hypothetical protein BDN67DRAFT_1006083 [Paxillus ammoniavirescens]|nr:hypothetical protein BDN67DRAFT_1006083 [Paxillus ammoniavirescens]